MERKALERIFSHDRKHDNRFDQAIEHYKANIEISESFYPLLSILEVGLRNQMDCQLIRKLKNRIFNNYH